MKISEVMRPGAFTIADTDLLGAAQYAMTRSQIRHLPVVHGERLVGILSERDVLAARALAADDDRLWWSVPVGEAMQPSPQTARPDDSLTEVAGRMAAAKIGAMPIVERGKLLGIATVTDVLDAEVRSAMGPSDRGLTVVDVMTPWPVTVSPELGISEAITRMARHHVRHLPVIDTTTALVGILSERDIREAIGDPSEYLAIRANLVTAEPRVSDVMTTPVRTVRPETHLSTVARELTEHRIGAMPVVDGFGTLLGITSYVDVLRALAT